MGMIPQVLLPCFDQQLLQITCGVFQQPHKHHPCQKEWRDDLGFPPGFLFFPSPAAARSCSSLSAMLRVFRHSQVPHMPIRASESTSEGNQALTTVSRQICIWSNMLNCSLSTCHIHSCVCGYACSGRKVHAQAGNSLGQCQATLDAISLL